MYKDTRLFGNEKWYHTPPKDANMRIPDDIQKAICFLCVKLQGGENAGRFHYIGTAFLVTTDDGEYHFPYLVTAKHVIDEAKRGKFKTLFVRMNKLDGKATNIDLGSIDRWLVFEDKALDLAVLPFFPDLTEFDFKVIPESIFVSAEHLLTKGIGIGDDLFVVGLFTKRSGKHRNIPIVRSGIIAAMPDEPLHNKNGKPYFAYLAELRSIGGISGSPVFVYLDTRRIYDSKIKETQWQILLLGLIRGHWDLKQDLGGDFEALSDDIALGFNKGEDLNTGIAVVTPSHYIGLLLHDEFLKNMRKKTVEKLNQENQITEDSSLIPDESSDVFTQQDFEHALKKVSRKISLPEKEKKETSAE